MAIEVEIETDMGLSLPSAYVKIVQVVCDSDHAEYTYRVWADGQARQEEKRTVSEGHGSFVSNGGSFGGEILAVCYADLMAKPEFEGAQAV